MGDALLCQPQLLPGPGDLPNHVDACGGPGDQGWHSHAVHPPLQHIDAEGIAHYIDDIHHHAGLHGDLAVAGAAENGRAGIIQGNKREGNSGNTKIFQAGFHHVHLDGTEAEPDQLLVKQDAGDHGGNTQRHCHQHQLSYAALGFFVVPGAQELTGDHAAAGGQGCEQHQNHRVDHIHQGHAGNSRFAHRGDHNTVSHTHQNGQALLNHQRNDQLDQPLIGK